MSRRALTWLIVGAAVALIVGWIAANTYWDEKTLDGNLSDEAAADPFFAARRFAALVDVSSETLTTSDPLPQGDAALLLYEWNWNFSDQRRDELRRWVQAGGRLIVDRSLHGGDEFRDWTGLEAVSPDGQSDAPRLRQAPDLPTGCQSLRESRGTAGGDRHAWQLCGGLLRSHWRSDRTPVLELSNGAGAQLVRVAIGKGSVTAVNSEPFITIRLLRGDHARLLALAAQLRPRDRLYFMRGDQRHSLFALVWNRAAPMLVLALVGLALLTWRMLPRFGPLLPPAVPARRSLRAQVRGTAAFLQRCGAGGPLYEAERIAWARAQSAADPVANVEPPAPPDSPHRLAQVLAQIEQLRRQLLTRSQRRGIS